MLQMQRKISQFIMHFQVPTIGHRPRTGNKRKQEICLREVQEAQSQDQTYPNSRLVNEK